MGQAENTPPKTFRFESYVMNTGNLAMDAKASGKVMRGLTSHEKTDAITR
jgi:hypothetical protein